jgi:hypothetical protein
MERNDTGYEAKSDEFTGLTVRCLSSWLVITNLDMATPKLKLHPSSEFSHARFDLGVQQANFYVVYMLPIAVS